MVCVFESISFSHFTEVREFHEGQAALMFIDEHERSGRTSDLHIFSSLEEGEKMFKEMENQWRATLQDMKHFFSLDEG